MLPGPVEQVRLELEIQRCGEVRAVDRRSCIWRCRGQRFDSSQQQQRRQPQQRHGAAARSAADPARSPRSRATRLLRAPAGRRTEAAREAPIIARARVY